MTEEPRDVGSSSVEIGTGYPQWQLAKALQSAWATGSPKAREKATKWHSVLEGMFEGQLTVGSRTPVADTPAWVTLEVVTGGFATGNFVAGGDLRTHELELATELGLPVDENTRAALNGYFLSQHGQDRLYSSLESGGFRVDTPEEGALLVVSWLLRHQGTIEAQRTLDVIIPYFGRLRFFPTFRSSPATGGEEVFLQTAATTVERLRSVSPQRRLDAQEEAIRVWTPLYDESVRLLIATVEGDAPQVELDSTGKPVRDAAGSYTVSGGAPLQRKPEGWDRAANEFLAKYRESAARHRLAKRWHKKGEPFQRFLSAIDAFVQGRPLPAGETAHIRMALGRYLAKRGAPDTEVHSAKRAAQEEQCAKPRYHEIAKLLAERLAHLPGNDGVRNVESASRPIETAEATPTVPSGTRVPKHLVRKIGRAQVATISALIDAGYISSGDVLAEVLPQLTSEIRAASLSDPRLRRAYAHIYRAFRQRRSLLLLNLESQVRIEELPWIAALSGERQETLEDQELAATVLREVLNATLTSFPYAILPNKLLQEVRVLAKQADLDIPVVDEIAADIFMGVFSPKFARAARIAGQSLRGSVYERYYDIDYSILSVVDAEPSRTPREGPKPGLISKLLGQKSESDANRSTPGKTFSDLCASRADSSSSSSYGVAANGVIIEQQQILTTQNLGTLFVKARLDEVIDLALPDMVKRTFLWICRRQQTKLNAYHAALVMLKNTAYAWRQLIFYLAQVPNSEQHALLMWMRQTLKDQSTEFQRRFEPALKGLENAAAGEAVDSGGGRIFLGWTTTKHWLIPPVASLASSV